MAEVAEVVKDVQPVEKETEKKAVDVEDTKTDKKEKDAAKPKENGKTETNEKSEVETNGSKYRRGESRLERNNDDDAEATEVTATKRKSGSGNAPEGTPAEGVTPEKKAKISNEEKEKEKESTNGESEVASEGAGEAKNMSYQKH